jgi:hypothetical protein
LAQKQWLHALQTKQQNNLNLIGVKMRKIKKLLPDFWEIYDGSVLAGSMFKSIFDGKPCYRVEFKELNDTAWGYFGLETAKAVAKHGSYKDLKGI